MSTQKYTALMTSHHKKTGVGWKLSEQFLKSKVREKKKYTDALKDIYWKEYKHQQYIKNLMLYKHTY